MAAGLIALLDDIAAIAKVAAASLDDIALQTAKAGAKAAGVVIDDAAVTPRYVIGFTSDRELPIVARIAKGSLRNKLLFLLPGALALSAFLPSAITPLLMAGGAYLCFEGYEKFHEMIVGHQAAQPDTGSDIAASDPASLEASKVNGAIRTDMVLSAEIMAITLAQVAELSFAMKATVLASVGLGITVLVYGAVAVIVKADDMGVWLAARGRWAVTRLFGRGLVKAVPPFLKALSVIGMAAMLWVGGAILVHGLAGYGFAGIEHAIQEAGTAVAAMAPAAKSAVEWLVGAALSGLVGVAVGGMVALVMAFLVHPLMRVVQARA